VHRVRRQLTYSNVISTLCLVLLVGGGTAYAATEMLPKNSVGTKQLAKEAVTPAKLSKASKATLTGPIGPTGSTGAAGAQGPKGDRGEKGETGAAGSALAYARIEATGAIDTSQSKGIGGMTVTLAGSGEYCISGLPFAPKNVVANAQFFERGVNTFVGNFGSCPASTQVSYETWTSTGNSPSAVMILFN
jgi:hypothetical protein